MFVRRFLLGSAVATCAIAAPAIAQSAAPSAAPAAPAAKPAPATPLKGTWVGFTDGPQGHSNVTIVFDSTGTDGLFGSMVIPDLTRDSIPLEAVKLKADTLSFGISVQGTPVGMKGLRSGNLYTGEIWVQGNNYGTIKIARAGTTEAANLLTPPDFKEEKQ